MLKGSNNRPKIINAEFECSKKIYGYLKIHDSMYKTSLSIEFYYLYIDNKKYTMLEIANLTGNSESTIRRHMKKFNALIKQERIHL